MLATCWRVLVGTGFESRWGRISVAVPVEYLAIRHNLPLAWQAATDMSAIGWVMIANSSNCLISPGWLASIAEGDSIINATLLIQREKLAYLCVKGIFHQFHFLKERPFDASLLTNRGFSTFIIPHRVPYALLYFSLTVIYRQFGVPVGVVES